CGTHSSIGGNESPDFAPRNQIIPGKMALHHSTLIARDGPRDALPSNRTMHALGTYDSYGCRISKLQSVPPWP
ncbi:Hypothetical predicted protein, partial [Pelobates cultripes]